MEPDKVVIIVQNSSGQLFVHQRSADKEIFPSLYGLGAGGHVEPKESPIQAAQRELREELGLDIKVEPLFSIDFESDKIKHIVHVFKTKHDGEVKPCKEFQRSGWMNIEQINQLAANNKLCPDTKILYEKWKFVISKRKAFRIFIEDFSEAYQEFCLNKIIHKEVKSEKVGGRNYYKEFYLLWVRILRGLNKSYLLGLTRLFDKYGLRGMDTTISIYFFLDHKFTNDYEVLEKLKRLRDKMLVHSDFKTMIAWEKFLGES